MRKVITLLAQWGDDSGVSTWRQHAYNLRQIKQHMRSAQNKKRSRAKAPEQQAKNEALIKAAHQDYIDCAQVYLDKAGQTLIELTKPGASDAVMTLARKIEIEGFMAHATRQIDQIRRRVILGEVIAHEEKVFSAYSGDRDR